MALSCQLNYPKSAILLILYISSIFTELRRGIHDFAATQRISEVGVPFCR